MENQTGNTREKEVVIITGSSGLIGTELINRLGKKYRVIGLDKAGNPFPPKEAEYINFDITAEDSIRAAMERIRFAYGNRIASVIHLAAYYDFSGEPSPLYEEVTVKGTQNLLRVLQDFEVNQFVFSSTNLIYKPTKPGQKIDEDCVVAPNWDYPESKVDTEQIIREERGHMKAVLLRIAGIYDHQGHSIPLSHQIQRIYEKDFTSHFFSGDISHGNVFLHLEDLLDALVKTAEKRNELPEEIAINIGEPITLSYQELQKQMGELIHGEDWKTFELPKPLAKVGSYGMNLFGDPFIKPWMIDRADDHFEMDITRAKQLLDWQPKYTLDRVLPDIIQFLKNDPASFYKENKLELPSELEKQEA